MISIRGLELNNKFIIIKRVSVTDKKFKNISLNFIDIIYNPLEPGSFVRKINNNLYYYENSIRRLSLKRNKAKYFTALNICKTLSSKFITMDLETKNFKGNLEPYCVSIFDGKKAYSFYITDYSSSDDMLKAFIKFIIRRKYTKHRVYLHKFSYFDGIFLMRIISNIINSNNIVPIIKDGRTISLNFLLEKILLRI